MSGSVIADFMARIVPDLGEREEWVRGRVVLSRTQLVLANGDNRTTIPLTRVFDVTTGRVSRELTRSVGEALTVAYERRGTNRLAVVGSSTEVIERFANVLFKALLSGTRAFVRHPARLDGREIEGPVRETRLEVQPGRVSFHGAGPPVTIDLAAVTGFERRSREIRGRRRPVLSVRHTNGDTRTTTEAILGSGRRMNLLGRYLRRERANVGVGRKGERGEESIDPDEGKHGARRAHRARRAENGAAHAKSER